MGLVSSKLYRFIKKMQFIYFLKQRICNNDLKANLEKIQTCSKPKKQIRREMSLVRNYWHCKPYHYIRYGLFDKDLTDDELLDYIPSYYHYNYYTDSLYKGIDTGLYNSKLSLYKLFKERGVPTPEVIAIVKGGELFSLQENRFDAKTFFDKYDTTLFFKPEFGQGGTGINVFSEGTYSSFLASLNRNNTYIVQCGIKQRDDINQINSSSVNTLRVVTQYADHKARVCVCVMRMGRKGKNVDNSHQGGLSVRIDVKDGAFYPSATVEHGGGYFSSHPDSGFVFKGSKINGWNTIKSEIERCASLFPELKEIAWDVAVTPLGIEMIELNLGYGIAHLQCTCGGMRRILNIYPEK